MGCDEDARHGTKDPRPDETSREVSFTDMYRVLARQSNKIFAVSAAAIAGRVALGFRGMSHAEAGGSTLTPEDRALGAVVGGIVGDAAAMVRRC